MSNMIDPSPITPMEAEEAEKRRIVGLFQQESVRISEELKASSERILVIDLKGQHSFRECEEASYRLKAYFEGAGWEVGVRWIDRDCRYNLEFHLPGTRANRRRIFAIVAAAIMLVGAVFGGAAVYPHVKEKLFSSVAGVTEKGEAELAALIKQGNFSYVNSGITAENFPDVEAKTDPPGGEASPLVGERSFKIYHFDRCISSEEAIKEMEKDGYKPANLRELIAYSQNGWNGRDWVVALGQIWRHPDGDRRVPYVFGWGVERAGLSLNYLAGGWHGNDRFLAFRNS